MSEGTMISRHRQRLVSLDVLRGCAVIGMIFVNSSARLKDVHGLEVFPWLLHAHWEGLKIADLVFPAFVIMVGVSIPLSLPTVKSPAGSNGVQTARIFWRSGRLILLGLILTNLDWMADASEPWRWWDVLQRIGLVYGACGILFLRCTSRTLAGIAVTILLLYPPLLLLPSLDGLPNDLQLSGHNFAASLDRWMFGAGDHLWVKGPEGYDPEGLLGTLPAIAHGLIGVLVGKYLVERRDRKSAVRLALAGALLLMIGILWGLTFPIVKDLWSSSFVLVTAGLTTIALAGLHRLLDDGKELQGMRGVVFAMPVAFGINAIAAYVLHEVAAGMLGWQLMLAPYYWAEARIGERAAALLPPTLFVLLIWLCLDYLRRRNWIIKI